jgi:putative phosphoesterase
MAIFSCRIGVISDTHGLLRPQAKAFLAGSDHIVHAGDVGDAALLEDLRALAPLVVVRGNNDHGAWADALCESESPRLGGIQMHLLHDLAALAAYPPPAGTQVVVSGHSHRPSLEQREGVLYLNPGSAGPRRFRLPVTAAEILVRGTEVSARIRQFET